MRRPERRRSAVTGHHRGNLRGERACCDHHYTAGGMSHHGNASASSFFLVHDGGRDLREISRGGNRLDPWQSQRTGRVDPFDSGMRVWPAQYLPVQYSGVGIGGVAGSSHDFIKTIRTDRTGANDVGLAGAQNLVGLLVHDGSSPKSVLLDHHAVHI